MRGDGVAWAVVDNEGKIMWRSVAMDAGIGRTGS